MPDQNKIVDKEGLDRILTRIAHEILERNRGSANLVLMGMRTRGEFLANRIFQKIKDIDKAELPLGILDVTLYRDDFRTSLKQPQVSVSNITFDINGKDVILIDRGHRELPIRADYVGKNIPTSVYQEIKVKMEEIDGEDSIYLIELNKK